MMQIWESFRRSNHYRALPYGDGERYIYKKSTYAPGYDRQRFFVLTLLWVLLSLLFMMLSGLLGYRAGLSSAKQSPDKYQPSGTIPRGTSYAGI